MFFFFSSFYLPMILHCIQIYVYRIVHHTEISDYLIIPTSHQSQIIIIYSIMVVYAFIIISYYTIVFRIRKYHSKNGYRQNGHNGVRVNRNPVDASVLVKHRRSVSVVCPRNIYQVTITNVCLFRCNSFAHIHNFYLKIDDSFVFTTKTYIYF